MRPGDFRSAAYRSSRRRVRGLCGPLVGTMMGALLKDQKRFNLLRAGVVVHLFFPRAHCPRALVRPYTAQRRGTCKPCIRHRRRGSISCAGLEVFLAIAKGAFLVSRDPANRGRSQHTKRWLRHSQAVRAWMASCRGPNRW